MIEYLVMHIEAANRIKAKIKDKDELIHLGVHKRVKIFI